MNRTIVDKAILAVGAAVFVVSAVRATAWYAVGLGVPFFDWTFYARAVDRWLAGEPIYPGGRISTLGSPAGSSYAYPPASVPLMVPFASWPFGALLWETVIVMTLLAGTWAVVRIGWPERRLAVFGIVLLAMALLEGVMQGVALGNVNIATAGMLGFVWAGSRGIAAGTGVLGVIKVFPLALAAPRGRIVLAQAAAIAGTICLVTLPLVGIDSWRDYVAGLQASQPLCGDPAWLNLSLACAVTPFVGSDAAKWAGLVVAVVLVALALRTGPTFVGMALATGAVLAPATELHAHYLALVVVLIVIGFASFTPATRAWRSSS